MGRRLKVKLSAVQAGFDLAQLITHTAQNISGGTKCNMTVT